MQTLVQDLTGIALNYAVALAAGYLIPTDFRGDTRLIIRGRTIFDVYSPINEYTCEHDEWEPSSNWTQGGPIMDQMHGLETKQWLESKPDTRCEVGLHNYEGDWVEFGPTLLIAVMRVYVASKLGATVEIPDELV